MILELTASTLLTIGAIPTRASGETAQYVCNELESSCRRLRDSHSIGWGSDVEAELAQVLNDCRSDNWDGYGAAAIIDETYVNTRALLNALPLGTPAPSVGAEPDGDVTLEWYRSPLHTLSVSVTSAGDLHYAALIGPSRAHGTEPFLGEPPQVILDLINRITRNDNGLRPTSA
jgi:hypothetical protein